MSQSVEAMPYSDFFTQLGLFVAKDFFDAELCARLRDESRSAPRTAGTVLKAGSANHVTDETIKRRSEAEPSAPTLAVVKERLLALMPKIERHFDIELAGCQTPRLVCYSEGDFYQPHIDISTLADAPQEVKERQVSIVIFLNDEDDEPGADSYCGGGLTFYGLVDDPVWGAFGLPLIGERGLLIAFRPDVLHEVKPVTHGARYTVTSWFF